MAVGTIKWGLFGTAALCLLAFFRMPYEFYTVLRTAVTLTAIFAFCAYPWKEEEGARYLCLVMVIVFNPFFPFRFSKGTWMMIDLWVAIQFFYWAFKLHGDSNNGEEEP